MAELLSAHGIDVSVLSEASIADRAAANADGSSSTGSIPVSGLASAPPPASTALLSSFPAALQHYRGDADNRVPLEVPIVVSSTSATSPNLLRHFDSLTVNPSSGSLSQHSAPVRTQLSGAPGGAVTQLTYAPGPAFISQQPIARFRTEYEHKEVECSAAAAVEPVLSASSSGVDTAATPVSGYEAL